MVEEYKDRLQQAMKDAGYTASKLADGIGATYQAVKKVLDGKSTAFSAPNNTKAAQLLGVSSDWLAAGHPYSKDRGASAAQGSAWPFARVAEKDVAQLQAEDLASLEGAMALVIAQLKLKVKVKKDAPKDGGLYAGITNPDEVEMPFPMGPVESKPWHAGYKPKLDPETELERVLQPAISTARDVVANVSAGAHAANDEFEPVPELPDVRLAASQEGIEVTNEAARGVLHFRRSFLRRHNAADGRARVVYASGDSMEPIIPDRAAMLFVPAEGLTLRDVAGSGVWAINYDGKMLVKTIAKALSGAWVARSFNHAYPDILLENGVDVRVLGRIVWVGAALRDDMQGQWVRK